MDIHAWLRDLGLERYADSFEANAIDHEVLRELRHVDLEKLGVLLGHRKKLLKAIAALAGQTQAAQTVAADAGIPPSATRPGAKRRQLTVLFCDLVGSTELAARLDPEDLREVMRAYQAACADVVRRFEGYVARFLGDGVLAYFGWPRAHEDDAERAVRAGLQLVQDVARLEPRAEIRLQARVGVATGHVVVGDLISEGVSDRDAVSGDTPNLAAWLQAVAAPGSVVISPSTRRLVGGLFELSDLGPQRLKGFAEPLSAWQVEGQGRAEGRFESRQTTGLTPLVGREEEIALLLSRWRRAHGGEGQVVLLSGEPGIGKSRLVREVRNRLPDRAMVGRRQLIRGLCLAGPCLVVARWITARAGGNESTPGRGVRAVGERYLAMHPDEASSDRLWAFVPGDRDSLAQRIRRDFEEGDVVSVRGWLLSRTECRACALAVLR